MRWNKLQLAKMDNLSFIDSILEQKYNPLNKNRPLAFKIENARKEIANLKDIKTKYEAVSGEADLLKDGLIEKNRDFEEARQYMQGEIKRYLKDFLTLKSLNPSAPNVSFLEGKYNGASVLALRFGIINDEQLQEWEQQIRKELDKK